MAVSGGRLGSAQPASATWTTIYKPAAGVIATVIVTFANTTASAVTGCYLAQVQAAGNNPTPAAGETKFNNRTLQAAGDVNGLDVITYGPMQLNGSNNDQVVAKVGTSAAVDVIADGPTET